MDISYLLIINIYLLVNFKQKLKLNLIFFFKFELQVTFWLLFSILDSSLWA